MTIRSSCRYSIKEAFLFSLGRVELDENGERREKKKMVVLFTCPIRMTISHLYSISCEMRRRRLVRARVRLVCCCCCCLVPICLLLWMLNSLLSQWIIYDEFLSNHRFSSVPFWNDSRLWMNSNRKNLSFPRRQLSIDDVHLNSSRLVISACSRNVFRHLPTFQKNVQSIVELFADYRIYLGESFSSDSTLDYLEEWRKNDSKHVRLFTEERRTGRRLSFETRTRRIASCRNLLLTEIYKELNWFDYYLVIDVDIGSSLSFDRRDFLSNFVYSAPSSSSPSWLSMTATQGGEYYDIWALRIEEIVPYDCWKLIRHLTSFYFDRRELVRRLVQIHQKEIPRDVPLIPVQSSFGGAALYPRQSLHQDCFYRGEEEKDSSSLSWLFLLSDEACEHVSFHQCLTKHSPEKSIFINPQFRIC